MCFHAILCFVHKNGIVNKDHLKVKNLKIYNADCFYYVCLLIFARGEIVYGVLDSTLSVRVLNALASAIKQFPFSSKINS